MDRNQISRAVLKRHPELAEVLSDDKYLTGNTRGGRPGTQIVVIIDQSPWGRNSLRPVAVGDVPPGKVLMVNVDADFSPHGKWQAFSPHEAIKIRERVVTLRRTGKQRV